MLIILVKLQVDQLLKVCALQCIVDSWTFFPPSAINGNLPVRTRETQLFVKEIKQQCFIKMSYISNRIALSIFDKQFIPTSLPIYQKIIYKWYITPKYFYFILNLIKRKHLFHPLGEMIPWEPLGTIFY